MNDYIVNAFTKEGENVNLEVNNLNVGCITSKNNKFEIDSDGNITAKSLSVENISIASQVILNVMYPVGSVYISVNDVNPSTFFGGSWSKIEGRFLLGESSSYKIGSTGGEASHKLTVEEMPSHTHTSKAGANRSVQPYSSGNAVWPNYYEANTSYANINSTGGNKNHNNMPPYLVVSMWKRIK